ncbi:MAG: bifunctional hydroxymethylpyrimidine kinase/phosphomethylpyrimidine kinase [Lysobacteraceae bacterium]
MNAAPRPCALTIAGSDSGGGAGIQADLKTFAAHGVHGLSAIAVLTAQNTQGVRAIHVPPHEFLRQQIDACFDDFEIGAVKLGMLANSEVIHAVADALEHWKPRWIVLDPVMVATSGARLLEPDALDALRSRLLPLASIITPNIPEAEWLLSSPIAGAAAADAALDPLLALGVPAVLLKGGHLPGGDAMIDRYAARDGSARFTHARLDVRPHGTGCTLAAAIAAQLCHGHTLLKACAAATDYVHGALLNAYQPARSNIAVLDHFWRTNAHNHGSTA